MMNIQYSTVLLGCLCSTS